jgi:septum formation protein
MDRALILASGSEVRLKLLSNAGISVSACPARVDEVAIRAALAAEQAPPRDVADSLAEMKARKVAERRPNGLVLGCDQVLDLDGEIFSKAASPADAKEQLARLSGQTHRLCSAAVLYDGGQPVWRHVGIARLSMRNLSQEWASRYVDRNWDSIRHSVGGYLLEEEGVRLFSSIDGDFFTILGLPLIQLLNVMVARGDLQS